MSVPARFQVFRIHNDADGYRAGVEESSLEALSAGELTLRVAYSSVNYKDALAGTGQGKILRQFPLVGGIDVAGHVVESRDARFREGDAVLVTGCGLSESRDGGYAEYLRVESRWAVSLPQGLSLREAMGLGTAGYTAGLCFARMVDNGQTPDLGPIVVTGATGGVGMLAIDVGTAAGFEMHAITGKPEHFDFLTSLGARQCISRHGLYWGQRPLETARWAGAIDNVGGDMLSGLTRVIKPYGNIASCGLAGSAELHTTVMPFLIRGVSILGIASAGTPFPLRGQIWQRLAQEWRPRHLEKIVTQEVDLAGLPAVFQRLVEGGGFGRTLVRLAGD